MRNTKGEVQHTETIVIKLNMTTGSPQVSPEKYQHSYYEGNYFSIHCFRQLHPPECANDSNSGYSWSSFTSPTHPRPLSSLQQGLQSTNQGAIWPFSFKIWQRATLWTAEMSVSSLRMFRIKQSQMKHKERNCVCNDCRKFKKKNCSLSGKL